MGANEQPDTVPAELGFTASLPQELLQRSTLEPLASALLAFRVHMSVSFSPTVWKGPELGVGMTEKLD